MRTKRLLPRRTADRESALVLSNGNDSGDALFFSPLNTIQAVSRHEEMSLSSYSSCHTPSPIDVPVRWVTCRPWSARRSRDALQALDAFPTLFRRSRTEGSPTGSTWTRTCTFSSRWRTRRHEPRSRWGEPWRRSRSSWCRRSVPSVLFLFVWGFCFLLFSFPVPSSNVHSVVDCVSSSVQEVNPSSTTGHVENDLLTEISSSSTIVSRTNTHAFNCEIRF